MRLSSAQGRAGAAAGRRPGGWALRALHLVAAAAVVTVAAAVVTSASGLQAGSSQGVCSAQGALACGSPGSSPSASRGRCAGASRPVVHVIATRALQDEGDPADLLGPSSCALDGPRAAVRMVRAAADGWLPADPRTGFRAAAGQVARNTAAVVFVSDGSDAGKDDVATLTAITAALSTAAGRAPDARLFVTGPVGAAASDATRRLQRDLRVATRIAGAEWIDPAGFAAGGTISGERLADGVEVALASSPRTG